MTKKIEKKIPDFIQIPYQLIGDKNLAPIDRLVYGAIYFYSKMSGERCFATNTTIAKLLHSTPKTVGRSLQKLEDARYIIRDFSDPDTKKNRTEIIPLVAMSKLTYSKNRVPPNGGTKGQNDVPPNGGTVPPIRGTGTSKRGYPKNGAEKTDFDEEMAQNKGKSGDVPPNGVPPNGGVIESIERIDTEKRDEDLRFDPSGQPVSGEIDGVAIKDESEGEKINNAIALFLPYFPGDFAGKSSAFAKPPTRAAVKELLKRYTNPQLADLLRRWNDRRAEKYRPEAGTVYEFCTYKLAKIESFLEKEGGLWAQRSISTPEQSKVRDDQYQKIIDAGREQIKKDKEDWLRDHPGETL